LNSRLTEKLGISVKEELLTLALTHRSFAYESGGLPTNERLEFLGDSVLGLIITEALYERFPDFDESRLSPLRSGVVNMRALAQIARDLELGASLRIGKGEENTGGRDKNSILADSLEALVGATNSWSAVFPSSPAPRETASSIELDISRITIDVVTS